MKNRSFERRLVLVFGLLLVMALLAPSAASAEIGFYDGHDDSCVIPESGPWPPCATNGNQSDANDDCIIPESGPWPPCATSGGAASAPAPSDSGACVIPESGPWPPCATSGEPAPAAPGNNDGCVIPETGAWPPCATGGGPAPAPVPPAADPTPPQADTEASNGQGLRITNVEVLNRSAYEVNLRVSYTGLDFLPLFWLLDPDNCFDRCDEAGSILSYPIDGISWELAQGEQRPPTNGTFDVAIDIDNLICVYNPHTQRIIITVTDYEEREVAIEHGGTIIFDVIYELPLDHHWCE